MAASTRQAINDIKLEGLGLALDEQKSGILCPFCEGGHSGEKSLSIARKETSVVYCCHRASCNRKGSLPLVAAAVTKEETKGSDVVRRPMLADLEFGPLPQDVTKFIVGKYRLTSTEITRARLQWITNRNRLWMPIYTCDNMYVGGVSKLLDRSRKEPKSINCVVNTSKSPVAFYGRPTANDNSTVWLVEDQFSAIRLSSFVNAGALLGTNLQESCVIDMIQHEIKHVVLCLDRDAMRNAMAIKNRYGNIFETFALRFPKKDPKDMTNGELDELLGND